MRRFLFALLVPIGTMILPGGTAGAVHTPAKTMHPHVKTSSIRSVFAAQASEALAHLATRLHVDLPTLRQQWQNVAICEVHGNWHMMGPRYTGIGFLNSSWAQYGGTRFAPFAGLATRDEQILIGEQITGGWVPDQYGCSPTGW